MKAIWFSPFLGIVLASLAVISCRGEAPKLTLDTVLEKWEKASQECKILDAKLKLWHYDLARQSDKPIIQYGRFYRESSNIARIDVGDKPIIKTNEWQTIADSLIWDGTESLKIDPKNRSYAKLPIEKCQELWELPHEGFFGMLAFLATPPPRLQSIFPLLADNRAKEIRGQYDVSSEPYNDDIMLTAIPRKAVQSPYYCSRIRILIDAENFRTKGIQYVRSDNATSLVLYDQKYNEKPNDRDQLIEPDLSGFHAIGVMPEFK
jgi:hypothetical protein